MIIKIIWALPEGKGNNMHVSKHDGRQQDLFPCKVHPKKTGEILGLPINLYCLSLNDSRYGSQNPVGAIFFPVF